ncbi:hypothetical protein AMTR_s00009p00239590 [Amborella trichopoda]|uniref:Uncharacterized protein n=1 Tax=Amborella trichopoda TaxID=13333 RepID=W1NIL9_AMBTC|nr:hypothetical protein AMTR_s00009p00239590 [Amborella trichopoda]
MLHDENVYDRKRMDCVNNDEYTQAEYKKGFYGNQIDDKICGWSDRKVLVSEVNVMDKYKNLNGNRHYGILENSQSKDEVVEIMKSLGITNKGQMVVLPGRLDDERVDAEMEGRLGSQEISGVSGYGLVHNNKETLKNQEIVQIRVN